MHARRYLTAFLLAVVPLVFGCSPEPPAKATPAEAGAASAPAARAAAPGEAPRGQLAALKEVVTGEGIDPSAPAVVMDGKLTVADIRFTPPAHWEVTPSTSSMRKAQYAIPGAGGKAEAVVYFFGTGQGGGVDDNVARWVGQFHAESAPVGTGRESREVGGIRVTVARARGTYNPGMSMGADSAPLSGQALLGLILESPGGPVFIKITGPEATVDALGPEVDALIASLERIG